MPNKLQTFYYQYNKKSLICIIEERKTSLIVRDCDAPPHEISGNVYSTSLGFQTHCGILSKVVIDNEYMNGCLLACDYDGCNNSPLLFSSNLAAIHAISLLTLLFHSYFFSSCTFLWKPENFHHLHFHSYLSMSFLTSHNSRCSYLSFANFSRDVSKKFPQATSQLQNINDQWISHFNQSIIFQHILFILWVPIFCKEKNEPKIHFLFQVKLLTQDKLSSYNQGLNQFFIIYGRSNLHELMLTHPSLRRPKD